MEVTGATFPEENPWSAVDDVPPASPLIVRQSNVAKFATRTTVVSLKLEDDDWLGLLLLLEEEVLLELDSCPARLSSLSPRSAPSLTALATGIERGEMEVWMILPLSLPSQEPRGPLKRRAPPRAISFLPLRIATLCWEAIFPVQASSIRHDNVCRNAGEDDRSNIRLSENSRPCSNPSGSGLNSSTRSAAQHRHSTAFISQW